uniref:Neur_chan_LBD domain-containing protein n=1 Tax=Steinernema glaseri TaxID=37863 RepID=A0A1I7Z3U0_9BILA
MDHHLFLSLNLDPLWHNGHKTVKLCLWTSGSHFERFYAEPLVMDHYLFLSLNLDPLWHKGHKTVKLCLWTSGAHFERFHAVWTSAITSTHYRSILDALGDHSWMY